MASSFVKNALPAYLKDVDPTIRNSAGEPMSLDQRASEELARRQANANSAKMQSMMTQDTPPGMRTIEMILAHGDITQHYTLPTAVMDEQGRCIGRVISVRYEAPYTKGITQLDEQAAEEVLTMNKVVYQELWTSVPQRVDGTVGLVASASKPDHSDDMNRLCDPGEAVVDMTSPPETYGDLAGVCRQKALALIQDYQRQGMSYNQLTSNVAVALYDTAKEYTQQVQKKERAKMDARLSEAACTARLRQAAEDQKETTRMLETKDAYWRGRLATALKEQADHMTKTAHEMEERAYENGKRQGGVKPTEVMTATEEALRKCEKHWMQRLDTETRQLRQRMAAETECLLKDRERQVLDRELAKTAEALARQERRLTDQWQQHLEQERRQYHDRIEQEQDKAKRAQDEVKQAVHSALTKWRGELDSVVKEARRLERERCARLANQKATYLVAHNWFTPSLYVSDLAQEIKALPDNDPNIEKTGGANTGAGG